MDIRLEIKKEILREERKKMNIYSLSFFLQILVWLFLNFLLYKRQFELIFLINFVQLILILLNYNMIKYHYPILKEAQDDYDKEKNKSLIKNI